MGASRYAWPQKQSLIRRAKDGINVASLEHYTAIVLPYPVGGFVNKPQTPTSFFSEKVVSGWYGEMSTVPDLIDAIR